MPEHHKTQDFAQPKHEFRIKSGPNLNPKVALPGGVECRGISTHKGGSDKWEFQLDNKTFGTIQKARLSGSAQAPLKVALPKTRDLSQAMDKIRAPFVMDRPTAI